MLSVNKVVSTIPSHIPYCFGGGASVASENVRKFTLIDKFIARTYFHTKTLDFKTSQEEINALFKFEGDEFFKKAYDFLCSKLAIPEKLKPQLVEMPRQERVIMLYDLTSNIIIKNTNASKQSKIEMFSNLRHELQHFIQNMNILRTEGIGEQAVEQYSKIVAKNRRLYVDAEVRNITLEQLKVSYDEQTLEYYKYLKDLLKNNQNDYKAELENLEQIFENNTRPEIQAFRELVLNEMPQIKAGTTMAKRSEKMLNAVVSSYFKDDGSVNAGKYVYDIMENEAILAGQVAELKTHPPDEKFCYIQNMKKGIKQLKEQLENEQNTEICNELVETAAQKAQDLGGFKGLISYLYD